jgi:hypothetical protein
MDGDDVGMGKLRGSLSFSGEALADVLLESQLGGKDLDGDPALEPLVPGAIDDSHPAPPDLTLDGIGVPQRLGESRRQRLVRRICHGRQSVLALAGPPPGRRGADGQRGRRAVGSLSGAKKR